MAGNHTGTIEIDVELYSSQPPLDESFEEIVEIFFQRGMDFVSLCEWACEETHKFELPAGDYRVRYCIDGMDKEHVDDENWDDPIPGQRHLIQFWTAVQAKDSIIRQTSESAAYWHSAWAGAS